MTAAGPPTVRIAELPNGLRLPYAEQGNRDGTPVVFLQGITDSWRSWELVLPHLPPSVRALALTQRGHGDASRPADGYHPDDQANDVIAFLDTLGIERAVLVGHSMGSVISQIVAVRHPHRVRGIVLIAAFAGYRGNPLMHELIADVLKLTEPVDPAFVREFQQSTLARPVPDWYFETVVAESLKLPARVWHALFGAMADVDTPPLSRIAAPTLIVWGDRDVIARHADQHTLAAGIRDARLIVYEGTGHALHWEEPERFARDLVAELPRFR